MEMHTNTNWNVVEAVPVGRVPKKWREQQSCQLLNTKSFQNQLIIDASAPIKIWCIKEIKYN
jgi:hypothetical protein